MVEVSAKPTVYLETTIISYLTARPSRDIVRQAHQQVTREWWEKHRPAFDVLASELVATEASAGDASAAEARLRILADVRMLAVTDAATELAEHLIRRGAIPPKAALDALHLGVAAANGLDYLLTWNCRHLANASMRRIIESSCVERGFRPPIICTPDALRGGADDEGRDRG